MSGDLVLLHGFGGTGRMWERVIARLSAGSDERARPRMGRPLAPDLPGHGASVRTDPAWGISFADCVEYVLTRAGAPARFELCGYSLGGRIALHVALAAPERVTRLVLVSSTAGIEDETERAARRAADARLADELERAGIEPFLARWRTQPLFSEDPPEVDAAACADYRRNSPGELAAVLRGVGTGEMRPLWARLRELEMPVLVLAGARDRKFTQIARRMQGVAPNVQVTILAGGHRLPLENPAGVARVLAGPGERA